MPRNCRTSQADMLTALRMIRRGASKSEVARQLDIEWRTLNAVILRAALLYLDQVDRDELEGSDQAGEHHIADRAGRG